VFCLLFVALGLASNPAAAAEKQIEVGAALVVVHGTHTEVSGRATAPAIPAPLLYANVRTGRLTLSAEGIPPLGHLRVLNSSLGLNSIELSYLSGMLSYHVTPRTSLGLGETIYNQETTYNLGMSGGGSSAIRLEQTDRSRAVGTRYSIESILMDRPRSNLVAHVGFNPRMTGIIGERLDLYRAGRSTSHSPWTVQPEAGSQFDATLAAQVQTRKLQIGYGIRYLNLVMRFPDGTLADRNAFVIPFISVGTVLGR
ncbi:MAG: hypothetical protein M3126_00595, partial [Candidatus Eremiobacteraeota bacterium]|nr:hypothetical protein [Candidatus Eremiobacteraeota bacterium]